MRDGTEILVEHDDRTGLRIAGWVTLSVLLTALGAVVAYAVEQNSVGCCDGWVLLVIPAPTLGVLALSVGLPLGLLQRSPGSVTRVRGGGEGQCFRVSETL